MDENNEESLEAAKEILAEADKYYLIMQSLGIEKEVFDSLDEKIQMALLEVLETTKKVKRNAMD